MHYYWTSALAPQVSDKRVTFAPETKSSASGAAVPADWGFRFVVEPLRGVHYRVVRELELICRFGGRVRSGSGASTAGTTFGPQVKTSTLQQGVHVSKRDTSSYWGRFSGVCCTGSVHAVFFWATMLPALLPRRLVALTMVKLSYCFRVLRLCCLLLRHYLSGGPRRRRGGSASATSPAEGCYPHPGLSSSERMRPGVWSPSLPSSVWSTKTRRLASLFGGLWHDKGRCVRAFQLINVVHRCLLRVCPAIAGVAEAVLLPRWRVYCCSSLLPVIGCRNIIWRPTRFELCVEGVSVPQYSIPFQLLLPSYHGTCSHFVSTPVV